MRDTSYATELARADIGGQRIERLLVTDQGVVGIRFSWWKDGGMLPRPLDLPEDELLPLLREAIRQGVFSTQFVEDLKEALATPRRPPDDFDEDRLIEMANLTERDTNVPGTIFISTALGSHGPRVKWYPGRPGRDLPCLVLSIATDLVVRDDFLPGHVSASVLPSLKDWVGTNSADLLRFWNEGETWDRHEVSAFLDGLRPLAR